MSYAQAANRPNPVAALGAAYLSAAYLMFYQKMA